MVRYKFYIVFIVLHCIFNSIYLSHVNLPTLSRLKLITDASIRSIVQTHY